MPDTTHWVHDLSPYAIEFTRGVGIRWYGLAYLAGLVCGFLLIRRWTRQGRAPLRVDEVGDLILALGLGMIIGGRVGYVLLYEPHLLWTFSQALPWWGLLAVNQGGMASHGGLIGIIIGAWWFCRSRQRSLLVTLDLIGATAPIGVFFGRLANFVNGELWGRPSEVPWAVVFPAAGDGVARHPSQLYGAVVEGLLPFLIAIPFHARHRRPGLTAGLLLVLYGLGRFIDEFFRMPDQGQPGGLPAPGHDPVPPILGFMSKGQFYTLPLIVAGIIIMIWVMRRPARPEAYLPPAASSPA